jgi:AAA family ATP:ADP antiporter
MSETGELTRFERLLSLITRVRPGEGRAVFLFFLHAFLLLSTQQMAKALREAFILTKFSAEVRAYAMAGVALVLMFFVPLYARLRAREDGEHLMRSVTIFFVLTLPLLSLLHVNGVSIAFVFYLWVGIYGVVVISQMWAYAADSFNPRSGQRLFVVIMLGANLGALVGARFTGSAVRFLGPNLLMVIATLAMAATLLLSHYDRDAIPRGSRALAAKRKAAPKSHTFGGIGLVLSDRYLMLVALFVILLNMVNSTGEFILADYAKAHAIESVAASGLSGDAAESATKVYLAAFYGNFQFWVTVVSLFIQLFLVARIYRLMGMRGALLVHPTIVAIGYGVLALAPLIGGFIPIFSLIRRIKLADEGVDYSLMNTTRQALFLPVDRESKYDGKLAIDTVFMRFGDLLTAGFIFVGMELMGWRSHQFALLNFGLSLLWIVVALRLGRAYGYKALETVSNLAPEAVDPIPDLHCLPGRPFSHALSPTAFRDPDPGDVLVLRASCEDGRPLPRWLRFDALRATFSGTPPGDLELKELRVTVTASDMDGLTASSSFVVRRAKN